MANPEQLEILKQGVEKWNRWRIKYQYIQPELQYADLSETDLCGAILRDANLHEAQLSNADLNRADLRMANLCKANLRGADLSWANLGGAILSGANLSEANLSGATLIGAAIMNAELCAARLLDTELNNANLTGAHLWETQRAGWSIKGVICESVYWDKEAKKLNAFGSGEFERLYSEKKRIQIKYPGGISALEIATLPALIQHLETSHSGTKLRFESIQDASGRAIVNLVFDDPYGVYTEQLEEIRAAIQIEAEEKALILRLALEGEKQSVLLLKDQVQALEGIVDKILLNHNLYIFLNDGDHHISRDTDNISGQAGAIDPKAYVDDIAFINDRYPHISSDTYNVSGQAGAIGPKAYVDDIAFIQIGGRIEQSMDLAALAGELRVLAEALKKEATTVEHYTVVAEVGKAQVAAEAKDSPIVAESLKSAGKWALDVATKIGMSLATEAIKHSTGMK